MTRPLGVVRRHLDLWLAAAAAVTATFIAFVVMRAWRIDLDVPLNLSGDGTQALSYVQNLMESGSPQVAPRLDAPFGQVSYDSPLGADNLNFAILKLISLLTGDAAATATLFFMLTFALIALTSYAALRGFGVARPVAFAAAVIYAVLPYHFIRGLGQFYLAAYFAVPLACFVLVTTIEGRPQFGLGCSLATRRSRVLRVGAAVLIAAVIASTGIYYAIFTVLLLIPAAVLGWVRSRSRPALASAALVGGVIVAVLVVNMAPTLSFWAQNGQNPDVPARGISETANYQLQPASLLMPVSGHRLGLFAGLADRYAAAFEPSGANHSSLGILASAGFVLLIVVALGTLVGSFRRRRLWRRERGVAALALIALAIALPGGVSSLVALVATSQIRAWDRLSIFIGFFAVLAVAYLASVSWRYLRRTPWRLPAVVGLVAVVVLAAADQTTDRFVPAYDQQLTAATNDAAFVSQIESSLPSGAAVLQLPYRVYPEGGDSAASADYDPLIPYLYSDQVRFSYGGIKGREAGWQLYVYQHPILQALPVVCGAGFAAVWLDRRAFEAGEAQLEEAALSNAERAANRRRRRSLLRVRCAAVLRTAGSGNGCGVRGGPGRSRNAPCVGPFWRQHLSGGRCSKQGRPASNAHAGNRRAREQRRRQPRDYGLVHTWRRASGRVVRKRHVA